MVDLKIAVKFLKELDNTTDTSSAPSTPSYSYKKKHENTDTKNKKSLTAETHYSITFVTDDKPYEIIQTEHASNSYTKDVMISNISVDDNAQLFETPRKQSQ